jgi:AcrR family transcriptional regulator
VNRLDPRVTRTRRLLIDGLIESIVEDGYDAITVRGIVQRAKVNRSTFYLHFRDKQDAMTNMEYELLRELAESVRNPTFTHESALRDYKNSNQPISSAVALFEHVKKYASLYKMMLIQRDFREQVVHVMKSELLQFSPTELEISFVSNGIVGIILYWLENGMKETVKDMSLWLTRFSLFPMGHFE